MASTNWNVKLIKINIHCELTHFKYAQRVNKLISIKLFVLVICCDNVATSHFWSLTTMKSNKKFNFNVV